MKNKLIFTVLAASLLLLTKTAAAGSEGETYFGLQYGVGNYDEEGISETYEPTLLTARLGYYLTPNFTIEGRIGTGMDDDTHSLPEFGDRDATLELDRMFGIYGTAHFNITESSSIYGLLGASKVKGTASLDDFPGLDSSEDNSSVSYGVGADIGIGGNWALNIEYVRYLDKEDFDLDVGSVGASFRF